MNGVLGIAQLLRETSLTVEQQTLVQMIYDSSNALLTIINDMLEISTIEIGQVSLAKRPIDTQTVIEDVFNIFKASAKSKNLNYQLRYAENIPPYTLGDAYRVRQILFNLLDNAIKFTHNGEITVSVQGQSVNNQHLDLTICIADTGIGIEQEMKTKVFEMFTQADMSVTKGYQGTGLGLSVSNQLCRLMGGEITVQSEVGKGSIFTVRIPLEIDATKFSATSSNPNLNLNRTYDQRALLVEDNAVNQKIALTMMQKLGLQVDLANNGQEALQKCDLNQYDIILMDIQMPVMDGLTTTYFLRQRTEMRSTPIIAMTATAGQDNNRKCREAGMNGFIAKPFTLIDLVKEFDQWLSNDS